MKPVDAESGALVVRKYMIGLFDREDGKAADWPLIADTLLRVAFDALDQVPGDARAKMLLERVHESAYDRIVGNVGAAPASAAPEARQGAGDPQPQPARDFSP